MAIIVTALCRPLISVDARLHKVEKYLGYAAYQK